MLCASSSATRVSMTGGAAAGLGDRADVPAGLGAFFPPEQVQSTPTPISVTSRTLKPLASRTWISKREGSAVQV